MSKTLVLKVDPAQLDSPESRASLELAAVLLRDGATVAFPTETVYGLGANALDAGAVRKIFEAKQRPAWDPLIVHVAHAELILTLTRDITDIEQMLIGAFWPGPLTLLVPRSSAVPDIVTAGRDKVGVRMPAHPVAHALLDLAGVPVAAPSANSFGRISPTSAQHVLEDLDERIDAIVDSGPTTLGLESTVLDARAKPPVLYRPGMISIESLRRLLPDIVVFQPSPDLRSDAEPKSLPSPGVGIRHYAPRAQLVLVDAEKWEGALANANAADELIGVLLPDEFARSANPNFRIFRWGAWNDPEQLAQRLFAGLRELDALGVKEILCPIPTQDGVGAALRDRLEKAAKPASDQNSTS